MATQTNIFARPPFAGLGEAQLPAWAFDPQQGVIVWANKAGLRFWGESDCDSLCERRFDRAMPGLARLRRLAASDGTDIAEGERLVFWTNEGSKSVLCRCEKIDLEDGRLALLVQILEPQAADRWQASFSARENGAAREGAPGNRRVDAGEEDTRERLREIADLIRGAGNGPAAQGDHEAPAILGNGGPPASQNQASDIGQTDLFAKISHEVRTPLNSIIGFSELMKAESFGPVGHEKYKGYVEDIHMSAQHALSLINDLLDISKLHAGEFDIHPERVNVNIIAAQCASAMEPLAQKGQISVRTAFARNLPAVSVDPRALKQILFNLLSNAVKFTQAHGTVSLSTLRNSEGGVTVRVEDSGVGMSQDEVRQAFKPFRQLDTAPSVQTGTGLGLPLARALAQANGARFELSSEPRKGTRIDVIFAALEDGAD